MTKFAITIFIVIVLSTIIYLKIDQFKDMYYRGLIYVESLPFVVKNNKIVIDNAPQAVQAVRSVLAPGALKVIRGVEVKNNTELLKNKIIDLTNQNRKENGNLDMLVENLKLDQSAEIKLKDMFDKQYFEHVSPSEVSVSDLGNQVSYEYITIGENLAMGDFASEKELVDAWMASPGHRANILNKKYTEIGVAIGRGKYGGNDIWMSVQHFGKPKSACPSTDESLKSQIDEDELKIKNYENNLNILKPKLENRGVLTSENEYNTLLGNFNTLVAEHNKLVKEVKDKIDTYNVQVRLFNTCAGN